MADAKSISTQRQAALDAALAQIDKQFGKGSAMRLGDKEVVNAPAIPTSSLALDIALGIGGIARGRVVEIYGNESSGKCCTADTMLQTNWGMLTIEEIFEACGQKASCTVRETDISHLGLEVVNEFGELEHVSALTHNNRRPTLRVTTSTGKSITVTHNHPVRVVSENGNIVWRKAGNLKPGNHALGVLGSNELAKDHVSLGEAVVMGYLVGDGGMTSPNRACFTQADPTAMAEFQKLFLEIYPEATFKNYETRPYDIHINSVSIKKDLVERLGLEAVRAQEKRIPHTIRRSGAEIQRAFLSALFECDGGVENTDVCLSSSSKGLIADVQTMLAGLGLRSTVSNKYCADYPDNTYYRLTLIGESSKKFLDEIGFRTNRRTKVADVVSETEPFVMSMPNQQGMLTDFRDSVESDRDLNAIVNDILRTKDDGSPFIKFSPRRMRAVIDWAKERGYEDHAFVKHLQSVLDRNVSFEEIVSIEDAGEQPTFDIVVPGTHSFVANGLAVHNTSLTLHVIANIQKQGGTAAFIDAEHALDPVYAANLGVDVDNLIISQPDHGEQALEIADTLIRSGAIDLVVVDSVAALVPKAEIAGDMGDSHMGLQARLMSQALRKITGGLSQTGTTIIFINQTREKIGLVFGSNLALPGGNSLKFYASQRMEIRRIETLKDGTDAVANRVRVKVVKNKLAPPFKQAEFDIIFGEGISYEGGIIDLGVEHDIIKKSGAWYTYNGDHLGQGKEKARQFLKDNPALAEELDGLIRQAVGGLDAPADEIIEEVEEVEQFD